MPVGGVEVGRQWCRLLAYDHLPVLVRNRHQRIACRINEGSDIAVVTRSCTLVTIGHYAAVAPVGSGYFKPQVTLGPVAWRNSRPADYQALSGRRGLLGKATGGTCPRVDVPGPAQNAPVSAESAATAWCCAPVWSIKVIPEKGRGARPLVDDRRPGPIVNDWPSICCPVNPVQQQLAVGNLGIRDPVDPAIARVDPVVHNPVVAGEICDDGVVP